MDPLTLALSIIDKSLTLALKIHDDIPKDQHEKFWEKHFERMQFLEDLVQGKVKFNLTGLPNLTPDAKK